jgi:trehalose 6-phosphate phosphatase
MSTGADGPSTARAGQAGEATAAPHARSDPAALPESPDGWAFFLDIDGTLVDLAPAPDKVVVPERLPGDLAALSRRLGGALALVTGRTIDMVDRMLAPAVLPVAGLHGAEIRFADGRFHGPPEAPSLARLRPPLAAFVAARPGLLLEDKGHALAVHYRAAPALGEAVAAELGLLVGEFGEGLALQFGKMVVEVRPAGANKGRAVETFLGEPEFAGRRPLAVGDDLTDEAMFSVVNRDGGRTVRVGPPPGPTVARFQVASGAVVRGWIARLAGRCGPAAAQEGG